MKKNTKLVKAILAIGVVGSALFGSGNALANVIPFTNFLTNSDFQSGLTGWQTSPTSTTAINVRNANDLINTTTGNSGFSTSNSGTTGTGFFNSRFAVLGDISGTITGTAVGEPTSGTFRLFQDFTLNSTYNGRAVISYDLNFSLQAVFDGLDSASTSQNDLFTATLINLADLSENYLIATNSNGLRNTCLGNATTCADTVLLHQSDLTTNIDFTNLLPGDYRLEFKLNEIATGTGTITNTAVGIGNIVSSGTINVPEPASLSLMGLGLAYLTVSRKKRTPYLMA
ncbi:PEP-CTERM sorting domain-containing protein [Crenothrix sp.]|uniref:PEP-CTERM sorting domain-containing protein n=1 Tax=Crenothrix sp. TaxID=3100433 RepID=UPI00374CEB78